MNYKRMWESLKKIINEEEDLLSKEKASSSLQADQLEAQSYEVDCIAEKMEDIEARELLLQTKEKSEVKKKC